MKYSPKLKKAAEEIKSVLKKYDIAALVTLHAPGFGEYVTHLTPSYSRVITDNATGEIRFRSRLQEDFKGDVEKKKKADEDTMNMLHILSTLSGEVILGVMELHDKADEKLKSENYGSGHSSNTEQNN